MTKMPQLMVAWLNSLSAITAEVGTRISTIFEPDLGPNEPCIVIGPVGGGPGTISSSNVDIVETWTVPIYAIAGRRADGTDDLPDNVAAWDLAQLVVAAMSDVDQTHYVGTEGNIVACRVISATPGVLPGNFARVTISAKITVWAT